MSLPRTRPIRKLVLFSIFCFGIVSPSIWANDLPLRVIAANLTSGKHPNYDLGHGERIMQALKPDVVLIQEFNFGDNKPSTINDWVDKTFAKEYEFYREDNARIPNGVISRFPIVASGEVPDPAKLDRDFAWARIDLPNTKKDLWAISVHFHTKQKSRPTESQAVLNLLKALEIPKDDYVVLGGDFNTDDPKEACLELLGSEFRTTSEPQPQAKDGKTGTNASRAKPYDWVFADADLFKRQVGTKIAGESFKHGHVFDSRLLTDTQLKLLSPVQKGDSGAQQMQHMAVVKDFKIPRD